MKIATKRAVMVSAAVLATALTLTACSNGSGNTSTNNASGAANAKIGLLLPDSVTARYEAADKPYFEAKVKSLCSGCTVLYANADGDASKQQQQAESMLTQGVKVLVLDPFDGQAAASIVGEAKAKNIPVISYDRLINSPDLNYYISFDNEQVGKLQATALVDKLKKDGVPVGQRHPDGQRLADGQQRHAVQEGRAQRHRQQRIQGARRVRHTRMGPGPGPELGVRPGVAVR
jgi:ABC-type xylose transport system, periplasmic component